MGDFFGGIYCWFENFFGIDLANYLWGQVSFKQTSNQFVAYGLIVIGVAVLAYLAFYKVIDDPNFNRWRSWWICLVIAAVADFVVVSGRLYSDYDNGLMVTKDIATGEIVSLSISGFNIFAFSIVNCFYTAILFFFVSCGFKGFSRNCSGIPRFKK